MAVVKQARGRPATERAATNEQWIRGRPASAMAHDNEQRAKGKRARFAFFGGRAIRTFCRISTRELYKSCEQWRPECDTRTTKNETNAMKSMKRKKNNNERNERVRPLHAARYCTACLSRLQAWLRPPCSIFQKPPCRAWLFVRIARFCV